MTRKRAFLWCLLGVALLLLASWLRAMRDVELPLLEAARLTAIFGIYCGAILAWGVSLRRRIMHRQLQRYLQISIAAMLFWLFVLTLKNNVFVPGLPVSRFCWYLFYIGLILLPLLNLFSALWIGREEDRPPDRRYRLLWLPSLALIAVTLTNDLHQLAFRFPGGVENWRDAYIHGPLYYIDVAWITFLILAMLFTLFRRSRIPEVRRRIWQPVVFLLIGVVYMVFCIAFPSSGVGFIETTAMFCALDVGVWESCIQTGLIPSNAAYRELFAASTIGAQIADRDYVVRYSSDRARPLSAATLRQTESAPVLLEGSTYLRSMDISGGHALWLDDKSTMDRLLTRLRETQDRLAENNDLLQAELALKKSRAQVDAQNRLYDQVEREIRPQLQTLEEKLQTLSPEDEDLRQSLGEVCVIGAYAKRRANLTLLGENTADLSASELELCIRESVDYLSVSGVACSFSRSAEDRLDTEDAKLAYDLFEAAVEAALPTLSSLLADLQTKDGTLILKLAYEDPAASLPEDWAREQIARRGGALTVTEEERTRYVSLRLPGGGTPS